MILLHLYSHRITLIIGQKYSGPEGIGEWQTVKLNRAKFPGHETNVSRTAQRFNL